VLRPHRCSGVSARTPCDAGSAAYSRNVETPDFVCPLHPTIKLAIESITASRAAIQLQWKSKALREARGFLSTAETIAATNLQRVRARSYTRLDNKQDEQPHHAMRINVSSTLE
jgi:hypothetical protein